MQPNFLAILVAALVPLLIGFVWYHPKVFGTAWMKAAGMTEDSMKGANMAVIFGVSLLFSVILSFALSGAVVHQTSVYQLLMNEPGINDPNSEMGKWLAEFMGKYGNNFRTFSHGALHGAIIGLFFGLPLMGTNALFERKGAKYIFINLGYWMVSIALMGGIISAWQ